MKFQNRQKILLTGHKKYYIIKIYYTRRRTAMKNKEAWDMLHGNGCDAKPLSKVLDEMGFDRDTYMIVRRNGENLKIADSYDNNGMLKENDMMTFGGEHYRDRECGAYGSVIRGHKNDFEVIDEQMMLYSQAKGTGNSVNGMTGSNNGVYSAMANMGDEFIITKDREIIAQLESQLGFAGEELGVPLSNGVPLEPHKQDEWKKVEHRCKQVAIGRARGTEEHPKYLSSPFKESSNSNLNTNNGISR